jgi:flavodoxin
VKVLVAYLSQTGNTRKVAQAIFEEIRDDKEIMPIDRVDSTASYDLAFLGFPVHGEGPDKKTAALLEKHCTAGRNVALFITHASPEGNYGETQGWLAKFRQAAAGANVVDLFDCQGQLAWPIKFFMSIYPNAKYRMWARMDNSKGQPDQTRLDRARAFSRSVMNRVHKQRPSELVAVPV